MTNFPDVKGTALLADALAMSRSWSGSLDLETLVEKKLRAEISGEQSVDVVAIGKASREMAYAAGKFLGSRVRRRFLVCGHDSAAMAPPDGDVRVGEHPIPGAGSLRAGEELVSFLSSSDASEGTVFLISGGASSLCVLPFEPLELDDLRRLWDAVSLVGADITTYNKVRAATSRIAGGAILRQLRSQWSLSLIMVDNAVSGAPWVGSAMTYDYQPNTTEIRTLVEALAITGSPLGDKIEAACEMRRQSLKKTAPLHHSNKVLADPKLLLRAVSVHARRRGYKVLDLGSQIRGDVHDVSQDWGATLESLVGFNGQLCVVGTGEVTVRVAGSGRGGRCQEFAWRMAENLQRLNREVVFVAASSDGRDFVNGVGGAWVDNGTLKRASDLGIEWHDIVNENDSYRALSALHQLLPGGHTGWNLCDIYFALT